VSSSGSDFSEPLLELAPDASSSELSVEFVPLVGVWLKCTVLLL